MVIQHSEQQLLQLFSLLFFFICSAVMFLEFISTSAKTGILPVFITALAVETHVQLGMITSPFF